MKCILIGEIMFVLSDITKRNLEKSLGVSLGQLGNMTADEAQKWIQKNKKKVLFSKSGKRAVTETGNPLLAHHKIRTLSDLDRKSKDLFGI